MKKITIIIWGFIMKSSINDVKRGKHFNSILKLIEMGSVISKGDLYNAINQLTD